MLKREIVAALICFTLLLLVVFTFTGCYWLGDIFDSSFSDVATDGHRLLTAENEICNISFEYPDKYWEKRSGGPTADLERGNFSFYLSGPWRTIPMYIPLESDDSGMRETSYIESVITIWIYQVGQLTQHKTAIERLEAELDNEQDEPRFDLVERSPIIIAGIEGAHTVYFVEKWMPFPTGRASPLWFYRKVYFDYDGKIWTIELSCESDLAEELNVDFQHILDTFKILD